MKSVAHFVECCDLPRGQYLPAVQESLARLHTESLRDKVLHDILLAARLASLKQVCFGVVAKATRTAAVLGQLLAFADQHAAI